jgi:hypothetical protein
MLAGTLLTSILMTGTAGCVTKAQARAEAQRAYAAGQQEAFARMQQARGPTVTVSGPVRNPFVAWTPEMTLAKAILEAVYVGQSEPKQITLVRAGQEHVIATSRLLSGEDIPLEAGDIVRIE